MDSREVVLEIRDISKSFPNVKALDRVSMDVHAGEVVALCGENGAGKSTLMKIISAVYHPDKTGGRIFYKGKQVNYTSPIEAKNDGIVLIFQELSLVKQLSVAENIYLGSLPYDRGKGVNWKRMHGDAKRVLGLLGCHINERMMVDKLPIAQQQMVEIARAIALDAKVLILDEPTSSLTDVEKQNLFRVIRELRKKGVATIYISHKLDEVFDISDRVVVLRDGKNVGDVVTKDVSVEDVVEMMIGRSIGNYYHKKADNYVGKEVLRVENLGIDHLFSNVSFSIREGDVLGLYGLVGAGRSEIVETIFGIRQPTEGKIYVDGKPVRISKAGVAVRHNIGLVPEDRKEKGLVLGMECQRNIALGDLRRVCRNGLIDMNKVTALFQEYQEKLTILTPSAKQEVRLLSGGNQQKVVIAKWLATQPKLLILDEPTRGIDVGSKAEIHKMIAEFAESGMAVMIISSEMPEIIGVSTRLITVAEGRITGELQGVEINEKNIMDAIALH